MSKKEIPLKNYFYLSLIILFSILLLYYMYLWFNEYKNEEIKSCPFDEIMQIINYNELNNYLVENKNAIIYASNKNEKEIKKFDKKLKKMIKENNLENKILYMDITNVKNKSASSVMVYKNSDLINNYELKKNNYSIDGLLAFLEEREVLLSD